MNATAATTIPYENQSDPQNRRDCGAACLSMVYRSLGKDVSPAEIWPAIAKVNRFGSVASTTHLMAKDAISRGFTAVAFQARHPLQALRLCYESSTRAILNHRPAPESYGGHYSVLVEVDSRDVVLHDPFYGPFRGVPHAELLELWQPGFPDSEIAGHMLIAVAAEPSAANECWLCGTPLPPAVACPRCKEPVALQPSGMLGCIDGSCLARMWNYIFCPSCDCGFTLGLQATAGVPLQPGSSGAKSQGAPPAPDPAKNPLDLTRVFAEVDKFCSQILTLPAAKDHPEIKKHLDFIASSKEKLQRAAAESLVHRQAHQQQLAKMVQTAKERNETHRKRIDELKRPSPPLDGNALGHALLQNLGFR